MEHLQWIFSGIGVLVLSLILPKKKTKNMVLPPASENKLPISDSISNASFITERKRLTQRFHKVLSLMNYHSSYTHFTIAKLATTMHLDRISDLEKYFTGEEDPSFYFIEKFCKTFGVNYQWMTEGKRQPFYNDDKTHFEALGYYEEIEKLQPESVFFIRCNSKTSEIFILLKLTDWNYKVCHRIWHLSSHVGGSGRSQILSFYRLIRKLKDNGYYTKCFGRTLNSNDFDEIYSGESFPAKILNVDRQDHPWWDDFTDINNKYISDEQYYKMYGESFIDAQRIVRSELKYKNI